LGNVDGWGGERDIPLQFKSCYVSKQEDHFAACTRHASRSDALSDCPCVSPPSRNRLKAPSGAGLRPEYLLKQPRAREYVRVDARPKLTHKICCTHMHQAAVLRLDFPHVRQILLIPSISGWP
jgi:hypothetical protein